MQIYNDKVPVQIFCTSNDYEKGLEDRDICVFGCNVTECGTFQGLWILFQSTVDSLLHRVIYFWLTASETQNSVSQKFIIMWKVQYCGLIVSHQNCHSGTPPLPKKIWFQNPRQRWNLSIISLLRGNLYHRMLGGSDVTSEQRSPTFFAWGPGFM